MNVVLQVYLTGVVCSVIGAYFYCMWERTVDVEKWKDDLRKSPGDVLLGMVVMTLLSWIGLLGWIISGLVWIKRKFWRSYTLFTFLNWIDDILFEPKWFKLRIVINKQESE
jgi:hypothetical protein